MAIYFRKRQVFGIIFSIIFLTPFSFVYINLIFRLLPTLFLAAFFEDNFQAIAQISDFVRLNQLAVIFKLIHFEAKMSHF